MTDTTAKIKAKGCSATGITEELAIKLHDQLDKKLIAIVELKSSSRTEKADGKQIVDLEILTVEPATDTLAEDHLREFARALYYNRAVDDAQPTLDGNDGPEPTVKDVLGRGQSLLDHDADGEPRLWDGTTDDGDQGNDVDADQPHEFIDGPDSVCTRDGCGKPAFAEIHLAAHDDQDGAA